MRLRQSSSVYSLIPVIVLGLVEALCGADNVNAQLPWHVAVVDERGRLLAWYKPQANLGYDHVVRLAWDFLEHKVPSDAKYGTNLKVYLVANLFDEQTLQAWDNWGQHNPANVYALLVDSLVSWYPYSGDEQAIDVVRQMLDYQLAHGTTPSDWDWPGVPFACSCTGDREFGRCLGEMPKEFYGGIETDKVGELGTGYLLFYEMTGESKYLDAAIRCADALAKHVRAGDANHTPWPFRLHARTGEVLATQEYGGMIVAPVRLFDELIRHKLGSTAEYEKARDTAWKWILQFPMQNDRWSGYFGDYGKEETGVNQALPTMTAYYILTRSGLSHVDEEWKSHVGHLIDWVRNKLGRGPYFGAWAIDEQLGPDGHESCCSRAGLGSDTSRWAAINAMYYEATGDGQAREDAFRSLNYATYFTDSDGRVSCCGSGYEGGYEFDDGYGDYIRHFLWAMGAVPDWAPQAQNHLLRSTSVVQRVEYEERFVSYRTYDSVATETLRLAFRPASLTADGVPLKQKHDLSDDGYTLQLLPGQDYVLRVRHSKGRTISISAK